MTHMIGNGLRVLILTPEFSGYGGGIITAYRNLVPALIELGCKVCLAEGSPWNLDREPARRGDLTLLGLTQGAFWKKHADLSHLAATPVLRRHLAAAAGLWDLARQSGEYDIVEAVDFGFFAALPLSTGYPVIQQMHGSVGQIARHDPHPAEHVDASVAHAIENELVRSIPSRTSSALNAGYWQRETRTPVSVVRPAWRPGEPERTSTTKPKRAVVLGRIQRWKGPHVLCEAVRLLGPSRISVDWYGRDMASGSPGLSYDAWLTEHYPDVWRRSVLPHAPLPPLQARTAQASALANLVPSTWDVFNLSAVEGMMSGSPTICSDGAGAHELIEHGVNGLKHKSGDAASLAEALDRALCMSDIERKAMAYAARATVERELDPLQIAQSQISAYRSAADDFAGPHLPGWIETLLRPPSNSGPADELGFLEQYRLRDVLAYAGRRTMKKLRSPSA